MGFEDGTQYGDESMAGSDSSSGEYSLEELLQFDQSKLTVEQRAAIRNKMSIPEYRRAMDSFLSSFAAIVNRTEG
jgi:hypothetical protein